MGRPVFILVVAGLLLATGGSAALVPVETRTQALLEIQAANEDEERAEALLRKNPPRLKSALERTERAAQRLRVVAGYLSTAAGGGAAESLVTRAAAYDNRAGASLYYGNPEDALEDLGNARVLKRQALELVRKLPGSIAPSQCADGRDNDGDALADAKDDPGCTSDRDARESSPFSCALSSRIVSGRLVVEGACSGAFSEFDVTLLDSQLNGRYDVKNAPSCGAPRPTGFRCSTKDGLQNPQHLVDVRISTTSAEKTQRVRVRLFDRKKRRIANVVLPPPR